MIYKFKTNLEMERKEIGIDRFEFENWVEWFKVLRTWLAGLKDQKWS